MGENTSMYKNYTLNWRVTYALCAGWQKCSMLDDVEAIRSMSKICFCIKINVTENARELITFVETSMVFWLIRKLVRVVRVN